MTVSEPHLSRIKIQGDSLSGQKNQVWIDDRLTSNVTAVNIRWDVEGINEATVGLLLLDGLDVDSVAKVRVDEPTHELLVSLGWRSPLTEPRTFEYPVVGLPDLTALATEAIVQIPDPDEPGAFFLVHFAAFCDKTRPWSTDLPNRISAVLQDSVNPEANGG